MAEKETQIGKAKMKQLPQRPVSFKLKENAVKNQHLEDKSVSPNKLSDDAIAFFENEFKRMIDDLQNQIDSYNEHGVSVSNEFGDDPHIGVSQKTTTDAINKIWEKLEEITGEVYHGINMVVTPEYFISEDGAEVSVKATAVDTNGIFEKIYFEANGVKFFEAENVISVGFDPENPVTTHIDDSTIIHCHAQIMGIGYDRYKTVTKYNEFWIGAGAEYADIMDVEHAIRITKWIRGYYEVNVAENGQRIILILGDTLSNAFMRADISFAEIHFTESEVEIEGKTYKVYTSEDTYDAGTYKVFING